MHACALVCTEVADLTAARDALRGELEAERAARTQERTAKEAALADAARERTAKEAAKVHTLQCADYGGRQ